MASSAKVNDRMPQFRTKMVALLDQGIGEAAKDTLIDARNNAPFKGGELRRSSDTQQRRLLSHRVSFWIEYARYQEFGGDASRKVRNYTTGGTGKHYLRDAGNKNVTKLKLILKKHASRMGSRA